ncbi:MULTISPECIES: plasmid partition protein ParG [Gammaproteobacteria]|uniref:ParG n=1 Tax=Xanthomonas fragariae TaxID=48664 RepID=A0ABY1RVH4_9XANT|nr:MULTISPECIES: plasmid partition protein ParG [Gammaproteobacteria]CAD7742125.1 hypothetical protein LMG31884_48390 [Xanthomonas hydrangeae]MCD5974810.1 chromosome partitioning protein ParB [Pseudomonas quasicaspiana]WIY74212.1 plasmid partition protein ParG [Xanthomonas fragariae]CAD7742129.1 hypothetical protein LMG31884_48390 [Xanthomonas hydrangeae]SMR01295.1 ParG [Xanthomonas fragariae]
MSNKGSATSARRPAAKTKKAAILVSSADKATTKRVNFDLSAEQHIRLKIYAAKQGKTVKDVLTDFVIQLPSE